MAHEPTAPQKAPPASTPPAGAEQGPIQGEGDYEASRRYREEVKEFLGSSNVEQLAQAAAPESAKQARDLALAEERGKDRSKGDDSADVGLMYPGRGTSDVSKTE